MNNGYGWVEYLLTLSKDSRLVHKDASLVGNMRRFFHKPCREATDSVPFVSINYAWSGATSRGPCVNDGALPLPDVTCDVSTVTQRWKEWAQSVKWATEVYVPPVTVQLEFFRADVKAGRVKPNPNDVVISWSGSNDLFAAVDYSKGAVQMALNLIKTVESSSKSVVDSAAELLKMNINPEEEHFRKVYIGNLFNFALNPLAYQLLGNSVVLTGVTMAFNRLVELHAFWKNLELKAQGYGSISIIDAFSFYDAMAKDSALFDKSFKPGTDIPVKCPNIRNMDLYKSNCKGYLFQYDGTHPTGNAHQQFAYHVMKHIEQHHETSPSTESANPLTMSIEEIIDELNGLL